MTENLNNKEYKFQIIIIVLLSIIICFQLIHCIKLYEISYNSQLANIAIFGGDINSPLRKEYNISNMRPNIIIHDENKKHISIHPKLNTMMPVIEKERIDINNN